MSQTTIRATFPNANSTIVHVRANDILRMGRGANTVQKAIPSTLGASNEPQKSKTVTRIVLSPDPLTNKLKIKNVYNYVDDVLVADEKAIAKINKELNILNKAAIECPICMEAIEEQSMVEYSCKHISHKDCLRDHIEHQINSRILQIKCFACENIYDQTFIKKQVSERTFEKYFDFSLKEGIKEMQDIVFCPKCSGPATYGGIHAILLGNCPKCRYNFCSNCKNEYHGNDFDLCHLTREEIVMMKRNLREKNILMARRRQEEIEAEKRERERKRKEDEDASIALINESCKKCPHCSVDIERDFGCHHIHCFNCRKHFCWLCLEKLDIDNEEDDYTRYEHFNIGKCVLFHDVDN